LSPEPLKTFLHHGMTCAVNVYMDDFWADDPETRCIIIIFGIVCMSANTREWLLDQEIQTFIDLIGITFDRIEKISKEIPHE